MPEKMSKEPLGALEAGRALAQAEPGEEVVISGTSGVFPDSDSVTEFGEKLFNKVDLITDDDRRWKLDHPEIPQRTGKLNNINKFDAAFFGIHYKQAHTMDPMCRLLLERAYEAVVDSGHNPKSLYGSRTGVFVGACFSESEKTWFYEKLQVNGFGITGCSRAMLANRISYWLGVNGPSYTIDSACSSSLYALEHGYRAIRDGQCDSAIIGGCNLCLHPYVSLQFARLGVLSMDGRCKSFDERANGYCRSEAVSVMFLQKKKDARRIYATLVHAKTNCDGYKEQGITFPSGPLQQVLLQDFYSECQIDPSSLAWVEAHGTGTRVGDPEEIGALENVFCKNRKAPLKIGSVKSNIGHSEPASGLCSVTKVIIAMETGYIPPNINFITPRSDIEAFHNGKISVVTEKTPWEGGLVGVNSFGFGGANCHVLLRWNEKAKINNGAPKDDLPRLVNTSGRTQEAVDNILQFLGKNSLDIEYVKLYHEIHKEEIPGHLYRGFTIITKENRILARDIKYFSGEKRPTWLVFSGLGSQWAGMGSTLFKFPVFASLVHKCQKALKQYNVDLADILCDKSSNVHRNGVYALVGLTTMQMGIFDLLKSVGLVVDGVIGVSMGELSCGYAAGCLTAEEAVLAAYSIANALVESDPIEAMTVEIGMNHDELKKVCPPEVEIVEQWAKQCRVSGPRRIVEKFVNVLKTKNVALHEVNTSRLAYHTKYTAKAVPRLVKYLQKAISGSRKRPSNCLSGSGDKRDFSAEYLKDLVVKPVLPLGAFKSVQISSVTLEVTPSPLLQPSLRQTLKKGTHIATSAEGVDPCLAFLTGLGSLYEAGVELDIAQLYPKVAYPVSRSTPMISPLVRWEHSEDWYVTSYRMQEKIKSGERTVSISLKDDQLEYISGHIIDGRNLFPATGYLALAWETIGLMRGELFTEVPVVFENVRFHRATNLSKDGSIDFVVMVQKGSGNFEVVEGGAAIVTGRIYVPMDIQSEISGLPPPTIDTQNNNDLLQLASKDIYKELRLRGYNYKGLFRSLVASDNTGTIGRIQWHNNWVAYMDNMLQMDILQSDTRGLFVPTSIQRLVIDVKKHMQMLHSINEENKELPVYVYKDIDLIRSGGVEIRGLRASAIARRKPLGDPVLEKHEFVPHSVQTKVLSVPNIVRMYLHLALENDPALKVKVVEIADPDTKVNGQLFAPIIGQALGDLPLIQAEITLLSRLDNPLLVDISPEITIEEKKIVCDQSVLIVTASNLFDESRSQILLSCLGALKEGGFLIARESLGTKVKHEDLIPLASHVTSDELIVLLRKAKPVNIEPEVIRVTDKEYSWLGKLQEAIKSEEVERVLLLSEGEQFSGLMGFVNCIRKEPGGEKVRALLVTDQKAPKFSVNVPLYVDQLRNDLAVNVYKGGQWGSYRHLPLEENKDVEVLHSYMNVTVRGDLSSLSWIQGSITDLKQELPENSVLVNEYFGALNFRDIMTATGKIAPEVVSRGRLDQECVQGLEYSGIDMNGRRVMGMVEAKGLASLVVADKQLMWEIPDKWTLEDAATIPIVYGTAIYALEMSGRIAKGDTVLIHAGSGGVGLAAIQLCLHFGCTVFTTVGTPEKREFIKKQFPQLTDRHIGNSRDTSFEQLVMKETNGRGVDIVLNSLAEEKLLASVRCLAPGGRFLEIGKFDLANNNPLGMDVFLKETSFHGIMLDNLFHASPEFKVELHKILQRRIDDGAIRPLARKVFSSDQIEQAFRYMAAGKHIGKVLVKVKDEPVNPLKSEFVLKSARPRYYCDPAKSYVLAGGLGGFGLELADWLVLRGARKLVLTSRTGLQNGYQAMRIRVWRSYGVELRISTHDIKSPQGVQATLREANELGPVGGIFNLAVVLRDALFDNQTEEDFKTSLAPKANATHYLDKYSRTMCPELDQFVIFSSVSCGRGNAGQTNYGMANSIMERICEARAADGLPGLAVQWGCIGDVGLVAEMQEDDIEIVIGGTLQQQISSCLKVLDDFMTQKCPVVSSMVVAEKRVGSGSSDNIVDIVANILGLRDLKTVSLHSTLAELGMDSMMAVEIKQTLEREFEVFLTPQDIRSMTFAKLHEISSTKDAPTKKIMDEKDLPEPEEVTINGIPQFGFNYLLRVVGDEQATARPVVRLPSLYNNGSISEYDIPASKAIFMIPGIEGVASVLEPIAKNLNAPVYCLQLNYNIPYDRIDAMADSLLPQVKKRLQPGSHFNIAGYSFGGLIALEMVKKLEEQGYVGNFWLLDGAPEFLKMVARLALSDIDETIQRKLLLRFIDIVWPKDKTKLETQIKDLQSWESRLELVVNTMPLHERYSKSYQKLNMTAVYSRIRALLKYKGIPNETLSSSVILVRPTEITLSTEDDYGISKYCKKHVPVHFIEGNHITILDNVKTAELINKVLSTSEEVIFKKPLLSSPDGICTQEGGVKQI